MNLQPLIRTDLNLLVTLYTILEERSVSKAADRLYVTQSAVSRSLSKLREIFDDPLFTRFGNRLVPSPFLKEMEPILRTTLGKVNTILQPQGFDPEHWQGTIKIGLMESMDILLIPKLLAHTQKFAPGVTLETSHYRHGCLEQLENGDLDIVVSTRHKHYPEEFLVEKLFSATSAILMRTGHPLQKKEYPFAEIIKYPKTIVRIPDWKQTHIYHSLSSQQDQTLDWEIEFEAESLLAAVSILRATDNLLPVPDVFAMELEEQGSMRFSTIKEYRKFTIDYVSVTHQRTARSPAHQWLRKTLLELGQEISNERDKKLS